MAMEGYRNEIGGSNFPDGVNSRAHKTNPRPLQACGFEMLYAENKSRVNTNIGPESVSNLVMKPRHSWLKFMDLV